jgi:hypothetical protein
VPKVIAITGNSGERKLSVVRLRVPVRGVRGGAEGAKGAKGAARRDDWRVTGWRSAPTAGAAPRLPSSPRRNQETGAATMPRPPSRSPTRRTRTALRGRTSQAALHHDRVLFAVISTANNTQ